MKIILKDYDKSLSLQSGNKFTCMPDFFEEEPYYCRLLLKYLEYLKVDTFEIVLYIKSKVIDIVNISLKVLIQRYIEWNKKKKQKDTFEVFLNNILQIKFK